MVSGFEKFAGLNGIETSLVAADCGSIKANAPANANSAALVRIIKLLGWICTVRGARRSAVARQTRQRLLCSDSSAAWAVFGSLPHVRNGSKAVIRLLAGAPQAAFFARSSRANEYAASGAR